MTVLYDGNKKNGISKLEIISNGMDKILRVEYVGGKCFGLDGVRGIDEGSIHCHEKYDSSIVSCFVYKNINNGNISPDVGNQILGAFEVGPPSPSYCEWNDY